MGRKGYWPRPIHGPTQCAIYQCSAKPYVMASTTLGAVGKLLLTFTLQRNCENIYSILTVALGVSTLINVLAFALWLQKKGAKNQIGQNFILCRRLFSFIGIMVQYMYWVLGYIN